jgi:prepilin-type N-terminal cleavage/methylation domain-containing protein
MLTKRSRSGFTLAEVLVTVTIIAVLAAVIVPAVVNQVGKGDVPSVAGDFSAIRTAITSFTADTRHFPGHISDLTGTSLPSASKDFSGTVYGKDTALYKGPYLPTTSGPHTGPTGGVYADSLTTIASSSFICLRDDTVSAGHSRVPLTVAKQADLALDGAADPVNGVVRYSFLGDTLVAGTLRACLATH